ncbi:MAG: septal ring lytic transglycosylase RlpA family protein [Thiohalocapsa sp.]
MAAIWHARRVRLALVPVLLLGGLLLAGCASDSRVAGHHGHRFQIGRPNYTVAPYQVKGVWYTPRVDYSYDETGTASWYGPGFDGKPTSDGEIYDMNELTAAHKTLPLPSVVQVTNLQNGRALRLRVNDRGPFVDGRIIDLSRRAAQLLGFDGAGTAPVRVRILKDESIQVAQAAMRGETGAVMLAQVASEGRATPVLRRPQRATPPPTRLASAGPASLHAREVIAGPIPTATPRIETPASPASVEPPPAARPAPEPAPPPAYAAASRRYFPSLIAAAHAETLRRPIAVAAAARRSGRIFVQAGAFAMPENAQRVRARIASLGHVEVVPMRSGGGPLYRVRVGPVTSEAEAAQLLRRVVENGYPGARVVAE